MPLTPARRPALVAAALLATSLVATLGASPAAHASAAVQPAAAAPWSLASKMMVVSDTRIDEDSGLTRSTYDRSTIFVHNDSGDSARVFALDTTGRTVAVLTLKGATAHDWEDIASGPDHTLWVGDIGDNKKKRSSIQVIRFTEPATLQSGSVASTTYQLTYPDGAHNAEGLMVQPTTGQVYVVTKSGSGGSIYRAPATLSASGTNTLTRIASAPTKVTGADFSPSGTSFVLRNYTQAWIYTSIGGTGTPVTVPHQRQGESIGFDRTGSYLMVGSEGVDQPIWRIS